MHTSAPTLSTHTHHHTHATSSLKDCSPTGWLSMKSVITKMFPVSLRLFPVTVNPSGEPRKEVEGRIDERGGERRWEERRLDQQEDHRKGPVQ